jgi:hypothetical protein
MKHLNELEWRLEQAAEEVRMAARHSSPPSPLGPATRRPRAWVVFAAAFGAVALAVGALPLLFGSGNPDVAGGSSTSPVPTTTTGPATTSPPEAATCSAVGLAPPSDQTGLPEQVAQARTAIAAAAIACDYETLEALASPDLNTSFGGGGFDNLPDWEAAGTYPALALLVKVFDTPYAVQHIEGVDWYVWPSAFAYDTWEEIPEADLEALLEVYTQEELDQIATFGSYAGWRIGITEEGDWRFFVAGD